MSPAGASLGPGRPPSRGDLGAGVVRTLSRGGWGNADVVLVRHGGALVVVKDFAPRPAWTRHTIGRFLIRREAAVYRALEGVPGVPRLLGRIDGLALALEYRPGEVLGRGLAGRLPSGFLDELRQSVAEMHARGVVHLDLRHRSNVLAGEDGHPVLIDFASALRLRPRGLMARWLAVLDRRALRKWETRLARPS